MIAGILERKDDFFQGRDMVALEHCQKKMSELCRKQLVAFFRQLGWFV